MAELESESPFFPVADSEKSLRAEYRKRNSLWELRSAPIGEEEQFVSSGWKVHRRLKTSLKLQRQRSVDERLENKWWVLLYKMGYHEMNSGRRFRILFDRHDGVKGQKQIDVFAKDSETVIVSECKASEKLRRRSLQKEIEEFGSIKGEISTAIKKFYGKSTKLKILWFFVTENVVWSDEDRDRARANQLRIVTENELPYYTQLVDHLGRAARFQFLAEFLRDQRIPEMEGIKVPATRGALGGKTFYSFVTTPRHLLKIGFVNHRTLDDPEGHPTYQRLIQRSRLKAIGEFIRSGGYFPNNLLINFVVSPRFDITQKDAHAGVHYGELYLPDRYKSAWIIDGQHRLYGYANLPDSYLDEKLVVVAFEKMKKAEEANLFVTINHEQRSVPKNLLDDLEGQLGWGSEDPHERVGAIAARLIQALNKDLSGPLYHRFTAEGLKSIGKVCLTVPQVKIGLKRSGLVGRVVIKGEYQPGPMCGATDNATLMRAQKIVNGYFQQIANSDIARWDAGREGRLCTNEGIQAFLLLLGEIISFLYKDDVARVRRLPEQQLLSEIAPVLDPILDFIRDGGAEVDREFSVRYGSGGPKEYLFRLAKLVKTKFPDFSPIEYDDWELAQSEEFRDQADKQLQRINILVQKHIFSVFRAIYGEKNGAYWEKGVVNKDMKASAYRKAMDYEIEDRRPLETYLDFIDYKKIVEASARWKLFKDVFDIPAPGKKGQAKNIDWMETINELRRISAHAAEGRNYKSEDFTFIDRICKTLEERVVAFDYSVLDSSSLDA